MFGKTLFYVAVKVWTVYTADPHAVWIVNIIEFYTVFEKLEEWFEINIPAQNKEIIFE
jgi:hypothetical protein